VKTGLASALTVPLVDQGRRYVERRIFPLRRIDDKASFKMLCRSRRFAQHRRYQAAGAGFRGYRRPKVQPRTLELDFKGGATRRPVSLARQVDRRFPRAPHTSFPTSGFRQRGCRTAPCRPGTSPIKANMAMAATLRFFGVVRLNVWSADLFPRPLSERASPEPYDGSTTEKYPRNR
jgi:hypothetical protein